MENVDENIRCPIFGILHKQLDDGKLPDKAFVVKEIAWIRKNHCLSLKQKTDVLNTITNRIRNIWQNFHLPVLSDRRIKAMILSLKLEYENILKSIKKIEEKNETSTSDPFRNYKKKLENILFDISACKCEDFSTCTCSINKQVPQVMRTFLKNMRSTRTMSNPDVSSFTSNLENSNFCKSNKISTVSKRIKNQSTAVVEDEVRSKACFLSCGNYYLEPSELLILYTLSMPGVYARERFTKWHTDEVCEFFSTETQCKKFKKGLLSL